MVFESTSSVQKIPQRVPTCYIKRQNWKYLWLTFRYCSVEHNFWTTMPKKKKKGWGERQKGRRQKRVSCGSKKELPLLLLGGSFCRIACSFLLRPQFNGLCWNIASKVIFHKSFTTKTSFFLLPFTPLYGATSFTFNSTTDY